MKNDKEHEMGDKIIVDESGAFQVSSNPIVTFHVADQALLSHVQDLCSVVDSAVEKAYGSERKVLWQSVEREALEQEAIGLCFQEGTTFSEAVIAATLLLRNMAWDEAADFLVRGIAGATSSRLVPDDSILQFNAEYVTISDFADAMVECMDDDAESDAATEQYDELADKFHEEFEAGAEKTAEFAHKAMEKAREKLTHAGHFTEEQGHRLKTFLENDFVRLTEEVRAGAKEKLNPSRLGAGALASMSKLLHKTGVVLSGFAEKADGALACKSGEITSAGKLTCTACGYEMNFKKTGRVPPCPKCHKTEFTKGY